MLINAGFDESFVSKNIQFIKITNNFIFEIYNFQPFVSVITLTCNILIRISLMAVIESNVSSLIRKSDVILLDIEGTTTSISYVKDTLFPFIRNNLKIYFKAHWHNSEFRDDLVLLKEQATQDEINKVEGLVKITDNNDESIIMETVVKNVLWQMDLDRKTKALKQLQGHIMRDGYKSGHLKGHIYSDVLPALKSWVQNGKKVYIYSSGSIEAQKLLFGHSEEGNLIEWFSGHFDTEIGPKIESSSYGNIVNKLNCRSEDVLFLTDVPKEANAAKLAGMEVVLVIRPGNSPLTANDKASFPVIESFQELSC